MPTLTVPDHTQSSRSEDFERIYREYAPLVYRTAWGVLGSREDAEDVLQTIFVKLLRREFPPDLTKHPKAYLYRAAVNLSLDTIKMRRRRPVQAEDAERIEMALSSADGAAVFDEGLHQRLYEAIGRLKPEAAEVVLLRYMQNKSTQQIAKMLGTSRSVIAVRLFRARVRLKVLLRNSMEKKHETR